MTALRDRLRRLRSGHLRIHDRGRHLGSDAAGRFLRAIGKPAFIATPDMVAALIRDLGFSKSRRQANATSSSSVGLQPVVGRIGRDLTSISRVVAMSVRGEARHRAR